jgi:hypothetical protein
VILARGLIDPDVTLASVERRGIADLPESLLAQGRGGAARLRLIGCARRDGGRTRIVVAPALVAPDDAENGPFHAVDGANKAVRFRGDDLGEMTLVGGASSRTGPPGRCCATSSPRRAGARTSPLPSKGVSMDRPLSRVVPLAGVVALACTFGLRGPGDPLVGRSDLAKLETAAKDLATKGREGELEELLQILAAMKEEPATLVKLREACLKTLAKTKAPATGPAVASVARSLRSIATTLAKQLATLDDQRAARSPSSCCASTTTSRSPTRR